ncbi:NlpC/P60 family protein [Blastococcus sp. SYSU D00820]
MDGATRGLRERRRHGRGRRWLVRGAGTGIVALVALGLTPGTAAAAPSNAEVAAAQAQRDAAAAQAGQVAAQLAQAQAAADAAHQAAQIALQDYEETQAAYEAAQAQAAAAEAAAAQAAAQVDQGRAEVAAFARRSYMQGSTAPGMAALMSSGGPAELLERATLLEAAGTHRVDVVAELTVLEEQATAAEVQATQAATQAGELQTQAAEALAGAQAQEVASREQAAALVEQQAVVEEQLAQAEATVTDLEDAQSAAAAQQAAAAAAPAPAPARPQSAGSSTSGSSGSGSATTGSSSGSSNAGGSNSGGSGSSGTPTPPPTTAGAPSGSAVQTAIDAALSQRGLPYSWGGGGSRGPSYGIPPDTGIYGFDCSGLTEYAYAQAGIAIGGTSRDQYYRFRAKTVSSGDLQPGDLVFWASGSSYTSIYHVALYIGGGKVVQAPQSNDVVKVSNMWFGNDYFGAVRPTA